MSNLKLDDIKQKIQSLKQQKSENRETVKNDFPFQEITRDILNKYKKSKSLSY